MFDPKLIFQKLIFVCFIRACLCKFLFHYLLIVPKNIITWNNSSFWISLNRNSPNRHAAKSKKSLTFGAWSKIYFTSYRPPPVRSPNLDKFWLKWGTKKDRGIHDINLLLTEFDVRTVSYRPSLFPFDLRPKLNRGRKNKDP